MFKSNEYINKYMKLVREHINEKFAEDSDPIKDMGIGVKKIWREAYRDMKKSTHGELIRIYFPDSHFEDEELMRADGVLAYTLKAAIDDHKDIKDTFEYLCDEYHLDKNLLLQDEIKKVLKDRFSIYIDIK